MMCRWGGKWSKWGRRRRARERGEEAHALRCEGVVVRPEVVVCVCESAYVWASAC